MDNTEIAGRTIQMNIARPKGERGGDRRDSRGGGRGGRGGAGGGRGHKVNAPSNLEIAVLKTYPFDSAVQRMTVITKKKGSPVFNVYVKGAPEKVASLCRPETSK